MRLYLIRHGETQHNFDGLLQGHGEVPLNDTGINQASRCARRLAEIGIDQIYASDIRRAAMTAGIIGAFTGAPIVFGSDFHERNPGDLSGKTYEEGISFFEQPEHRPPNGESVPDFLERVGPAFDRLIAAEGASSRRVAVVTHGMVCGAFLRLCIGKTPEEVAETSTPNTSITIADYDGDWSLVKTGDASHLDANQQTPLHATGA